MKRGLTAAVLLVAAASSAFATPLIWRGAGMLKPLGFQAYVGTGYLQTAKKWVDSTESWVELGDASKTTTIKVFPAVMFAPVKNLEVGLHAPLFLKTKDTLSSMGLGDAWFKARYGILQGKLTPVKLTFTAAAVFPTAAEDANPSLGDRTLNFGFGLIGQTQSLAGFVGHLRLGYWLNGKKKAGEVEKAQGNMLEYVAKVDYNFTKKFQLWLSGVGTMQAEAEGNAETNRHMLSLGAVWKPLPVVKLNVRPKVLVPLEALSKGGSINPWEAGLDFWVDLP
ncbi:transporter [candidate division WOR-3 bacterium]|nr:transporter [candidate division WOR-3 bacterium]